MKKVIERSKKKKVLFSDTLKKKDDEYIDETVHPEQVPMAGGKAASSKIPHFHLIPTIALERLAKRFQLGIERKGDKSWNAISNNQEVLRDKEFLIERLSHIILHAMKLRDKLFHGDDLTDDDDAAAIAWAGCFAICATEVIIEGER